MDINMPTLDGIETTRKLTSLGSTPHVIALSMFDDDIHVIRMIRAGARAYVLKNAPPEELIRAIKDVYEKGYHFSDLVSGRLIKSVQDIDTSTIHDPTSLSERELTFLKHCCTELTYKEIGSAMHVSPRTAEGYGKQLCDKLGLKTRVGLVLYAIRHKLFNP
jgi:DNA-binding NarL/FixJ family response regulator